MVTNSSVRLSENGVWDFYRNKRVLITGNTGFKGTWLTRILLKAGAIVTGYSLEPPTEPNLFSISGILNHRNFTQITGDIRDLDKLKETFAASRPEIILHLAAQPIVRDSYQNPVYTYSVNVMGTVNLLECIRVAKDYGDTSVVRSFLNVTTDKVYHNREWCWGYREDEPLDGYDPYSNSKSCSELVTHSYKTSFFSATTEEEKETGIPLVAISTARAGNVIGGGDFAVDRIIPDSVRTMQRAYLDGNKTGVISVRNPYSTRPYQHVLEPLSVYLTIAARQYEDPAYAGYYNVGPDECDCVTTWELVELFCREWNKKPDVGVRAVWEHQSEQNAPHEANVLKLDCSRLKSVFNWKPIWHIGECMEKTVEFSKVWLRKGDIIGEMDRQIALYFDGEQKNNLNFQTTNKE